MLSIWAYHSGLQPEVVRYFLEGWITPCHSSISYVHFAVPANKLECLRRARFSQNLRFPPMEWRLQAIVACMAGQVCTCSHQGNDQTQRWGRSLDCCASYSPLASSKRGGLRI